MIKRMLIGMLLMVFVLSACAPVSKSSTDMMEKPTEEMMDETPTAVMEKPTEEMMDQSSATDMMEKPTEEMMETSPTAEMEDHSGDDMMAETPEWLGYSLVNVKTGESFSINDFKGKVVLVETLAMWCPNCKKQQQQIKALHEDLGEMGMDLVSIGLDVDANENAQDLKAYIESNGFDWVYAVATEETAREIGNQYGNQFLNPPSTPILIIDRGGTVHQMPFGIKSAAELKSFIQPFLDESM